MGLSTTYTKVETDFLIQQLEQTQQQVNYNGGSKWHSRIDGYLENERVVLDNGDIVKSTIDGNTNNPNVNMTGWVKTNSASQIFDESGLSQQALNNGVESIIQLRLTNPKMKGNSVFLASANLNQNQGGGRFVATPKAGLVDNGGTIISSANPELYWVRVDYDRITPEMFGAGLEIEDNTDPLERFLKCCGDGYHGTAEANKKYKITVRRSQ